MKAAVYQAKKNEKTGKREAGEERTRATDFKEAECCPFAVVQGAARRKNCLCEGSARGNLDLREGQAAVKLLQPLHSQFALVT